MTEEKAHINETKESSYVLTERHSRYYSNYHKTLTKAKPINRSIFDQSTLSIKSLTGPQKVAYETIKQTILSHSGQPSRVTDLFFIHAIAGAGKSFLLKALVQLLKQQNLKHEVIAYTGIASHSAGGCTVHSFLNLRPKQSGGFDYLCRLPVSKKFGERVKELQYLLIDECSLINCSLLYYISDRLSKARRTLKPFGNIKGVILFGDLLQLPAVIGPQLYDNSDNLDGTAKQGACLFKKFQIITLSQSFRQSNDVEFEKLLNAIRRRKVGLNDIRLLRSRLISNVNDDELSLFNDSIAIFPFNSHVLNWNYKQLKLLGNEIVRIPVSYSKRHPIPDKSTDLYLSSGAPVVLTTNINVKLGLCNGSKGTVHKIIYNRLQIPNKDLPLCVLVEFYGFNGPNIDEIEGKKLVAIVPQKDDYYHIEESKSYQITKIPLELGFASSVHKVQSLTLPRALIYFGQNETFLNQTYTCLSRCRSLKDILILDSDIDYNRFTAKLEHGYAEYKQKLADIGILVDE